MNHYDISGIIRLSECHERTSKDKKWVFNNDLTIRRWDDTTMCLQARIVKKSPHSLFMAKCPTILNAKFQFMYSIVDETINFFISGKNFVLESSGLNSLLTWKVRDGNLVQENQRWDLSNELPSNQDETTTLPSTTPSSSPSITPSSPPSATTSSSPSVNPSSSPSTTPSSSPSTVLSPQGKALKWLIQDLSRILEANIPFDPEIMLQRYALAVLYYSLSLKKTGNGQYWLKDGPECDWYWTIIQCDSVSKTFVERLDVGLLGLKGTIPTEIGYLTTLKRLFLDGHPDNGNQVLGTIPTVIGNLSNLEFLSLINNDLSGTIPTDLGSLSKLYELRLQWNQLSGTIPIEVAKLSSLKSVNLQGNHLSGTIPKELSTVIKYSLNLSKNQFEGYIPDAVCDAVYGLTADCDVCRASKSQCCDSAIDCDLLAPTAMPITSNPTYACPSGVELITYHYSNIPFDMTDEDKQNTVFTVKLKNVNIYGPNKFEHPLSERSPFYMQCAQVPLADSCFYTYFNMPIDGLKFVVKYGGVEVLNTVGSCTGYDGYCATVGGSCGR